MVLCNTNSCCYNRNKSFLAESIMKVATAIPTWFVWRGDNSHHPHKKPSVSKSSSSSNDCFVFMMVLLLLLTCVISTIIMSKIIAITSSKVNDEMNHSNSPRTTNLFDSFSIPQFQKSNYLVKNDKAKAPFSTLLRRKQQQQQHQHRRLYEFVTPNIRDCSESGLLDTCRYVEAGSNGTGDDILFDGTCPSNLQQMLTDNWCYNGEKEVCCGLTSDDCCGIAKSYLALFFLVAMVALSPIFILIICAYGRCCICYPKLWNAKSNRGCGTPRPSSSENHTNTNVDSGVTLTDDLVAVNDEEKPVSK